MNATVAFEGTAVYVFCIVNDVVTQPSSMSFFIDDDLVDSQGEWPSEASVFSYNVLMFSSETIGPGPHTLTVSNSPVNNSNSLVWLDYVVHTVNVDLIQIPVNSSSSSSASTSSSSSASSTTTTPNPISSSVATPLSNSSIPSSALSVTSLSSSQGRSSSKTLPSLTISLSSQTPTLSAPAAASSSSMSQNSTLPASSSTIPTSIASGLPNPESSSTSRSARFSGKRDRTITIAAVVTPISVAVLAIPFVIWYRRRRTARRGTSLHTRSSTSASAMGSGSILPRSAVDRRSSDSSSRRTIPDDSYTRPYRRSERQSGQSGMTRIRTTSTGYTGHTTLPPYAEEEPLPPLPRYPLTPLEIPPSFRTGTSSVRDSYASGEPPSASATEALDAIHTMLGNAESRSASAFGFIRFDTPVDPNANIDSGRSSPSSPARADSIHTVGATMHRVTSGYSQAFELPEATLQIMSLQLLLASRAQNVDPQPAGQPGAPPNPD
ncbi:hypothetical protein CERSUDRAFT_90000 [Gelatoporia subvermispora B]|uniref:Uncharacterized protein n=1 Tax=Ceriporiopsis subvermispora (strain B) TaxID=914234 RepID=M2RAK6_CERS8|nr:hypothetical protein CERSUDRAFT_90000 [Gelatoporia subvermispora B]